MKIMVIRNSFSFDFGGAERLAVYIAREVRINGYESVVVSSQRRLLEFAEAENIESYRCPWWSKQNWSGISLILLPAYLIWICILTMWYLLLIHRLNPSVLHIMSKDDFFAGTFAGKLLGKGVVWTDCADLKFLLRNYAVWYKNPVGKLLYATSHLADSVTLVSMNERRLIENEIGKDLGDRFRVVYSVGKDEKVTPIARHEPPNVIVFCATSRLVFDKGIGDLIKAFKKICQHSNQYRLWLIGDGPDEAVFRRAAADDDRIVFWGHTNTPLRYLAAADVYVHPSHHEGFSLSLAEAAMLSKPMIATDVGGNPELVNNNNGRLVPVKNPDALASAMLEIASDKNLRVSLGKQARKDFLNRVNFAKIVPEEYMPLYEKASN